MSSVYTPSAATFTPTATIPSDGDAPTAASVNTPIETALDNIAYLHEKAFFGDEGYYPVPLGMATENTGAEFAWSPTLLCWYQIGVGTAGALYFPVPTPIKGQITELIAEIDGNAGPGGATHTPLGKPGTMPTVTLYRIEYSAAGLEVVSVGTDTDTSATPAIYDAVHEFGPTGMSEIIGQYRSYYVKFTGETPAPGALVDELTLCSIKVKIEGYTPP